MNFLKKLGQVALKVVSVATTLSGVVPFIPPQVLGIKSQASQNAFQEIIGSVITAENFFTSAYPQSPTGPAKLAATRPYVRQILEQEVGQFSAVKDRGAFESAVDDYINATVKLLGSLDENKGVLAPSAPSPLSSGLVPPASQPSA